MADRKQRVSAEERARQDGNRRDTTTISKSEKSINTTQLIQTNFRINPDVKKALADHFKKKGLSVGSGIRFIIMDYVRKEGIIY